MFLPPDGKHANIWKMIFLANFLLAISKILHILLMIYMWILILRAVFSWIPAPSLRPLAIILYNLTEPLLKPIRRYVPPYKMGGLDISPMILIILIVFIDTFLIKSLDLYAQHILRQNTWIL